MGKKSNKKSNPRPDSRRSSKPDRLFDELELEVLALRDQEQFDRGAADYQKELKKYIDRQFAKCVHGLRTVPVERDAVSDFYYSAPLIKRRTGAILRYLPEAVFRFAEKYPKLNIEHEFVELNITPCTHNYDVVESSSYIAVAAAIFMLDDLEQTHQLFEAIKYFPREDEFLFEMALPDDFHDCCYDDRLIGALAWLIQERYAEDKDCDPFKAFIDRAAAKRTEADFEAALLPEGTPKEAILEYSNRQRLDAILSMIRPAVAKRAAKRFEDKLWEFCDNVLGCIVPYREKQLRECTRLLQMLKEMREFREGSAPAKSIPPIMLPAERPAVRMEKLSPSLEHMDQMWDVADRAAEIHEACSKLNTAQTTVRFMSAGAAKHRSKKLDESLDDETVKRLASFTIDNPYELCFALVWLLDSGSDLPWLITPGSGVIAAAAEKLPWTKSENSAWEDAFDEDDGPDEDISADEGEAPEDDGRGGEPSGKFDYKTFLDELKHAEPKDWIEKESELYSLKYTDAAMWPEQDEVPEDALKQWNLPQLVYSYTGLTMPRRISFFDGVSKELLRSGVEPELAKALELYLELAGSHKRTFDSLSSFMPDAPDEGDEEWEDLPDDFWGGDEAGTEELQEQIRSLKDEARRLKAALSDADRKAAAARRSQEQAEADHESEHQELIELRELVFRLNNGLQDDSVQLSEPISLPYAAKHRMVVFGGHATWLKAIQPLLPNVRFIPSDMLPNANLIRHAEMVWVQTNALAHKDFYKIADVTRTHKIPLRYFGYASAEKCARQLAAEDMK